MWQTLCEHFFSRFVRSSDTVVDVGAGYCEFINHIRAARKIAIDLNPDVRKFAMPGIEILNEPCTTLGSLDSNFADVVFMSNFLEHGRTSRPTGPATTSGGSVTSRSSRRSTRSGGAPMTFPR